MPDIADLIPQTDLSAQTAAPASIAHAPGLWHIVKDAAESEWIGPWVYRKFARAPFTYDPTFQLTPEHVKELGAGIPPEAWSSFADAENESEAQLIRQQLLDVYGARQ